MQLKRHYELIILFVGVPVFLALPIYLVPKLIIGALGLFFVILVALKSKDGNKKDSRIIDWKSFSKSLAIKFVLVMVLTTLMVYLWSPEALFKVPRTKPITWLVILFVYSFLSVYPQELLYRPFFFNRYGDLFESDRMLIFMNALLFSLAHLFFRNTLVLVLTFIGGLIFAFYLFKDQIYFTGLYRAFDIWLLVIYSWAGRYARISILNISLNGTTIFI